MKKIFSILISLVMMLSTSSAFAQTNSSNIKVQINNLTASGNTITANLQNISDTDISAKVVVAGYDETGVLTFLSSKDVQILKGATYQYTQSQSFGAKTQTIKMYVWDDYNNMIPLADSKIAAQVIVTTSTPTTTTTVTAKPVYTSGVSTMTYESFTDTTNYSHPLNYRLFVPKNYDNNNNYSFLVYLNGEGSTGSDNNAQLANLGTMLNVIMEEDAKCIIAVPQCPNGEKWVDVDWTQGSYNQDSVAQSDEMSMVMGMINQLTDKYNIDKNRLYISGQSMGGYGVWDAITRYPNMFAGAVINCGAGDTSKASLIKDMPIMVLHGDADPTVPVSGSRDMVSALQAAGGEPIYKEFLGVDHYVQRRMFEDSDSWIPWIFAQAKNSKSSKNGVPFTKYDIKHISQFGSAMVSDWSSNQASSWSKVSTDGGMYQAYVGTTSSACSTITDTIGMTDYRVSTYMKIPTGSAAGAGVVLRYNADNTLINVRLVYDKGAKIQIIELENGSSIVTSYTSNWAYDKLYNLKAEVVGNKLSVYLDNIPVVEGYTIQKTQLKTSGSAGLRTYGGIFLADDVVVATRKYLNISYPMSNSKISTPYIIVNGKSTKVGQSVVIKINNEISGETIVDSNGNWEYKSKSLDNGTYDVKAYLKNDEGSSEATKVIVANTMPTEFENVTYDFSSIKGNIVNYLNTNITANVVVNYYIDNSINDTRIFTEQILLSGNNTFNIPVSWDLSKGVIEVKIVDGQNKALSDSFFTKIKKASLTLSEYQNYQVLQRDVGKTSKNVTISGKYDGFDAQLQARIVKADTNDVVVDWTNIECKDGNFNGIINVGQGGWYKTQVRVLSANETVTEISGSNKWGVGINILCIGQSNMVGTAALASNTSANTDGRTSYTVADDLVANFRDGTWKHLVDPYDNNAGSMAPSLGNELARKYNIPIGIIPAAASGAGLDIDPANKWPNWIVRDEANHFAYTSLNIYGRSITRAKNAGGIELIIMNQGEHDVSIGTTQAKYETMLKQLAKYYSEDLYENVPLFVCQLGISASTIAEYVGKDEIMTGIRNAHSNCDNGINIFMASTETDLKKNKDEIHFSISSLDIVGKRVANSIMHYFGDSSYYRGAKVASAQYNSGKNIIDVTIKHSGGTDFTPNQNITGFTVYDDGTQVTVLSAVKVDSTTIRLTLEKVITGTSTVRYLYGKTPNVSAMVKDNTPLNLPMEGTTEDIVVK